MRPLFLMGRERALHSCISPHTYPFLSVAQSFFLLGEKKDEKHGSVLHGFSPDILASIWGVDEFLAKKVLKGQKGAGIIKVEKKLTLPAAARAPNAFFGEFSFNLKDTQPELLVPRGGCANFVNCKKMPTLEKFKIGLSAALVKLEKGAIEVPSYMTNADAIVYVTKGKGRVNIAGPGGKNLVDKEVKCGDLFVVPKNYPVAKLAAKDDCFEMVAFTTCTFPMCMRLAGEKSVFHFLPKEIYEAAMDLDEETEKKFKEACEKREKTIGILPPPKEKWGDDSYEQQVKEFERSFMRGFVDYVEDIVDA
ncbi:hypothetical protein KFL_002320020 [Klebsormidium nitens]|uniref:Cupin type-1 domain-containing protein n=1 Tax=Klebsormidium nitens TaxID=105231 RepID=A0A1Y1IB93_KLENI|nr:hypothetical protein KFL_002320020 [Klebsormidium nitens]|eukprot:GAQ85368.1 hypothetical protein KFL_002320020 [Klebsormidium nitens]